MTAQFTTTATEAEALLEWMGNNGIDSDVSLYDGAGNDYSGEVFFGFNADVVPTREQVIETLERAAQMVASKNRDLSSDSLVSRIVNETDTLHEIARHVEITDGWAAVRVVFWNVALV